MPTKKPLSFEGVHHFLRTLFAGDLHAKRLLSLAGATLGVIKSASLAVAMIGQGLALARGRLTKHAIPLDALASGKQVDRLLSNPGIDVDALLVHYESIRICGVFTPRRLEPPRFHCRWPAPDTSVRTMAGACRRGSGFEFAAASAHRAWSTASVGAGRSAC